MSEGRVMWLPGWPGERLPGSVVPPVKAAAAMTSSVMCKGRGRLRTEEGLRVGSQNSARGAAPARN